MEPIYYPIIALLGGFLLDALLGDPKVLPHPVVGFGHLISWFEKRANRGENRLWKGAAVTLLLVGGTFATAFFALREIEAISPIASAVVVAIVVFFCLSALTLRREVRKVFEAVNQSTEKGRWQLSRIVGRDTDNLTPDQIRIAALETLAENLNDGVIAPLFWFAILGAPGMLAYKMVNTLDSMIGYKNERYMLFGRFAARLDDAAGYIPARLTALLMLLVSGKLRKLPTVWKQGKCHSSPNSGYPEAALANIIGCRFGGPNFYFGKRVEKPYIGDGTHLPGTYDMIRSFSVNRWSEVIMLALVCLSLLLRIFF